MTLAPFDDRWQGPHVLTSFTALPGQTTSSPVIQLHPNTGGVRITWKELPGGFGVFPTNVTVTNGDGSITWANYDIGFSALTNLKTSDIIVPVIAGIDSTIVVTVTETSVDSHKIFVSEIFQNIYQGVVILGSQSVQGVDLRQVGTSNVLTTFGELAVGGAGGQTIQTTTAVNAVNTNVLASLPGFAWHVQSMSVSFNNNPATAMLLTATDGFSTWSQYCGKPPGATPLQWTFPDGGLSFLVGAGVTVTLSADNVTTKLAVQAANRTYGP